MGQKLRDDKLGTIQHNSGSIQMLASTTSPAYITIGGQQYKITSTLSRLISSDVTMVANTRYQVFAVVNSGSVELRISLNENSQGPSGFLRWKLIGSFYANGRAPIAFGSFVNIVGVPKTSLVDGGNLNITADSVAPSGSGTYEINGFFWERDGDKLVGWERFGQTGNGSTGTGVYFHNMPANLIMSSKNSFYTTGGASATRTHGIVGLGEGHHPSNSVARNHLIPYDTTRFRAVFSNFATPTSLALHSSTWYDLSLTDLRFAIPVSVYVQGWSTTAIEDL